MLRLTIIISLALCASVLGHPHHPGSRIVGGKEVNIEDFPYQISLEVNGQPSCGGSIISENYIVTTAKCIRKLTEENLAVRAGSSLKSSGGSLVQVKTIHHNPNYDPDWKDQDIAILELDQALVFGPGIQAIALPDAGEAQLDGGTPVTVSGWGDLWTWSNATGVETERLRAVEIHVMDHDRCRLIYAAELFQQITDAMLCASEDYEAYKNFCYGDDGGPLVHDGKLVGIVSWTIGFPTMEFLCIGMPFPGVYTRVADADVRGFITSVTGI